MWESIWLDISLTRASHKLKSIDKFSDFVSDYHSSDEYRRNYSTTLCCAIKQKCLPFVFDLTGRSRNKNAIIGGIVGGGGCLLLIIGLILWYHYHQSRYAAPRGEKDNCPDLLPSNPECMLLVVSEIISQVFFFFLCARRKLVWLTDTKLCFQVIFHERNHF